MKTLLSLTLTAAAACAAPREVPADASPPMEARLAPPAPASPASPTGATIEPSGFATILSAPPEPYPEQAPPSDREQETQRLAREEGISVSEAESRMNPDDSTRRAALALDRRLKVAARGNYVDTRIIRDPRPRFVFYFRRDAAATLARYTSDPRFQAIDGGVPEAELRPLFDAWMKRFEPHRLVSGGSIRSFEGEVEFDVGVSRSEFEPIAAREGWAIPPQLKLNFGREIDPTKAVAPDAAPFVRTFARADRAPGAILSIAQRGRIVLRDGCFRLDDGKGGGPLVLFGRDTQLIRDEEGYLAVRSLNNPEGGGRIGEHMVWGGYPAGVESEPGMQALRTRCGSGPVMSVGEPTSAAYFRVRPWAIDNYATQKRISRQAAWEEIKACWARDDARMAAERPGEMGPPPRDCDFPGEMNPPPPPPRRGG